MFTCIEWCSFGIPHPIHAAEFRIKDMVRKKTVGVFCVIAPDFISGHPISCCKRPQLSCRGDSAFGSERVDLKIIGNPTIESAVVMVLEGRPEWQNMSFPVFFYFSPDVTAVRHK
ncbi:hypothetical protein D3C76_1501130 [compost metagenome]